MVKTYDDTGILLSSLDGNGVLQLTLNDAKRRNVLSEEMLERLTNAFQEASSNQAVRVVVLQANGPAFSAGHDLKEMTAAREHVDQGRANFSQILQKCSAMMQSIVNCDKPVIAKVSGIATAAGCQLVASCDLAIADDTAGFSTPGVHIGLFCSTPMVALSRNVSNKHAMEMLLTGDVISASRAEEIGLVNSVASREEIDDVVMGLATKIASKSSLTLSIGKRAFYQQNEMPLSDAYHYAAEVMTENMMAYDAKEGIDAFLAKREPDWQDK
ncbi:enoyl-CoA hydratase [Curvivirga aplysinae]|uniref:enoyl-CoA hydratase n=1 Tax=Curvivirga aplysinae TaxID=2529852 RepID=UPI0012BC5960|nr:enoyl-CoA hydratase [Curvivirga aplysinae]MTI09800.1 enoyl-CoA hydratase [Curvivirga aplysinae]